MFIHGVRPGPLIMIEFPTFVSEVVAMMLLATLAILILGIALTRPLLRVLQVPPTRLMPVIFVLCTIGSFAIASRVFDIWVMIAFGLLGFALRKMDYPMAPLVLGLVLGDILDKSLRRGLVLSDGDLTPFLTRPISLVLWLTVALTVLLSFGWLRRRAARLFARKKSLYGNRDMTLSLCNEVLRELDFAGQCALAKGLGYDGLEIAPFTLSDDPHRLPKAKRAELRKIAEDHGLTITGLHWLLLKPDGLSITSPDQTVRDRTIDVMRG